MTVDYDTGHKSVMKFCRVFSHTENVLAPESVIVGCHSALNSKPWRDRPPHSCLLFDWKQEKTGFLGAPNRFVIFVGYRPWDWITSESHGGRARVNGFFQQRLHVSPDGVPIDPEGKPLPEGAEPYFRTLQTLREADFNDYEFGDFLGES